MEKLLKIYTYVDGVNDTPFPNADAQIEIFSFNYDAKRMGGAPTISASVMYKDCLDKLWTGKEYVIYNGERYKLKQTPTSSKNNTDARYKHDLELVALRVVLDYVYFFDAVVENTPVDDKPVTNSTKVVFSGDIHEFAKRLNASLKYTKLDYSVVVDEGITSETKYLSFDAQPISSVLQEIYKQYEIPYYFVGNVIHIGFTSNAITQTFKYGANDALLSISKNNANNKIVNRCTGVGSSENIPYYYPNAHPLGEVDICLNKTKTTDISIVDENKFAEEVKLNTTITYSEIIENEVSLPSKDLYYSVEKALLFRDTFFWDMYSGFVSIPLYTKYIKYNWFVIPCLTLKDSYLYEDNFYTESYTSEASEDEKALSSYKQQNRLTEAIFFSPRDDYYGSTYGLGVVIAKVDRKKYAGCTIVPSLEVDADKSTKQNLFIEYYIINNDSLQRTKEVSEIVVDEMLDDYVFCKFCSTDSPETAIKETRFVYYSLNLSLKEPKTFLDLKNEKGAIVSLSDFGLSYDKSFLVGDTITFEQVKGSLIPYQDALMPPIYWQTKGAESFYNALNNTYVSPETGEYYSFENEYSDENRREHKETFDYIKPSIEFVRNGESVPKPINMFLEFAYDENDSDEIGEDGNYLHPYFFAKLRKFNGDNGFNLFDHANEKGEMTISMTSGNCGACNFVIGVQEDTQKNIVQVNDDGTLARDDNGNVKFGAAQDRQNDTINNEVWIALRKDASTFPDIMPNATYNYKPKACTNADTNDGDTFVITDISLPTAYIREAEERLKEEIIKYMKLNNSEKFTFSIKFSRIYLAENPNILAQLNENARIQIEYNSTTYELYVSSYQYKVVNNEVLPEITVELADTLSTNENALQQAINAVEHSIMSSVGSIDFYKQGLKYFVRKDVEDWARGLLHLTKGATFGTNDIAKIDEQGNAEFVSQIIRQFISTPLFIDGFAGQGFKLWLDENGKSNLTVDNLTARETFRVFEMLVTKLRAVNGGLFVSAANGTIKNVLETEDGLYYDIILENDNTFIAGDYMRCQVMSGTRIMSYWVEVYSVNNRNCRVLKSEFGSVMPLVGQEVVLCGSRNVGRQNAIHISASDDGQPRIDILNGISTKSLAGCLRTRLGNLDGIVDAYFGENQPNGDGLYSDNAYLKGEFILKNRGKSVDTMFSVQDGKIKSVVGQTQAETIRGKTFIYNASFTKGLDGWLTSDGQAIYYNNGSLLLDKSSTITKTGYVSGTPIYDNVFFVTINNGWIKQPSTYYVNLPEFDISKKYPLYFSVNVRCLNAGTLTVKLTGTGLSTITATKDYVEGDIFGYGTTSSYKAFVVKKPISSGDVLTIVNNNKVYNLTKQESFDVEYKDTTAFEILESVDNSGDLPILIKALTPTSDFVEINTNSMWSGYGDFYLEFTGEADFYGLTIYTEKTEVRHQTFFEQSDKLINFGAQALNADGTINKESGIVVQSEGAGLYAKKSDGSQALIATYTDDDETKVLLKGDSIRLEGDVSLNGKVSIDAETGALTAVDGTFEGKVTAKEGAIGDLSVTEGGVAYQDGGYDIKFNKDGFKIESKSEYLGDVVNGKAFTVHGQVTEDNNDFTVLTLERKLVVTLEDEDDGYKPVMEITENSSFPTTAFKVKGMFDCDGGIAERGAFRIIENETSPNYVSPVKSTFWIVKNDYQSNGFVYLPNLQDMRKYFGLSNSDTFAIPIKILLAYNSTYNVNITIDSDAGEGSYQYKIIDWDAGENNYHTMAKGDSVHIALIYDGATYYGQIINKLS